jgi:hypothetical protein
MLQRVNLDHFTPHVQTPFQIHGREGAVMDLTLTEAADMNSTARQEQFQLIFRGPLEISLPQGNYPLLHEVLGEILLFLVPIGRQSDGIRYQAVFNRMRDAR